MFFRNSKKVKITNSTKRPIRAGESATIKTKRASGHKGIITKRRKTGKIDAFTITHSPFTRGRKNIPLEVNPQSTDSRKSYLVKNVHHVSDKYIGKKQPDIKIKNPTDKSKLRKLKTNAKRKHK